MKGKKGQYFPTLKYPKKCKAIESLSTVSNDSKDILRKHTVINEVEFL